MSRINDYSVHHPVRRKLWQIESNYHCSIVGTCLDDKALAKAERASGAALPAGLQEYERHGTFVANCGTANGLSRQIQKALVARHRRTVEATRKFKSEAERAAWWEAPVADGDVAGPYWALMSHPAAAKELMAHAFGQVHMLSHEACSSNRHRMAKLNESVRGLRRLRAELAAERKSSASLREQCRLSDSQREAAFALHGSLVRRVDALAHALAEAERELREHENADAVARLARELATANRTLDKAHHAARTAQAKAGELQTKVCELEARARRLESKTRVCRPRPEHGADPAQKTDAMACDLRGTHVAYVGGLSSTVPMLRAAVEQRNGVFLHHDAGLENGAEALGRVLGKAEFVFCPVDCVSHSACLRAKQFCQARSRHFVPLRSAGVSSFVRGLEELDEAEFSS